MADLLSGGAVGAVTGEMLRYALQTIENGRQFGPTLEMNVETLNALAPLVEQIKDYSDLLGRPREEIERFETHIKEGKELVRKSKKLTRWKFFCFPHYQTKLRKKDEALIRHLNVNVQVENRRDVMEVLAYVKVILEIIMIKENLVGAQIWGLSGNQICGVCGAPGTCVERDNTLNNLKIEMMKDGVSVHVLTGMGGSGKTTLATKLCCDSQIKGYWCELIEFTTVWPGSESLVEMFKLQMLDCKILVTSRAPFRRFGTPFQLDPLDHDHAVSLFHQYAQLNHSSPYIPDKNLIDEIVKVCNGVPLALRVLASCLRQQPFEKWQNVKEKLEIKTILYNTEYGTMQDLRREQAIHQSNVEPFEERKRQEIIDLNAQMKKKLVGVIVALSFVVMLLIFLFVIF